MRGAAKCSLLFRAAPHCALYYCCDALDRYGSAFMHQVRHKTLEERHYEVRCFILDEDTIQVMCNRDFFCGLIHFESIEFTYG